MSPFGSSDSRHILLTEGVAKLSDPELVEGNPSINFGTLNFVITCGEQNLRTILHRSKDLAVSPFDFAQGKP